MPPRQESIHHELDPATYAKLVAALRQWLPSNAQAAYRAMIIADPLGWHRHPHFANGSVVHAIFNGNGLTAAQLGVNSMDDLWPRLLADAVEEAE